MPSLMDDLSAGSEWMSQALRSSGYLADVSPASPWSVDRFFDDHAPRGVTTRMATLAKQLACRQVRTTRLRAAWLLP
jgi:hypothetical protein